MLSSQPRDQQSIVPFLSQHFSSDWLASQLPDVRVRYGDIDLEAKSSPYYFLDFIFRKSAHIFLYTAIGLALYAASFSFPRKRNHPVIRWLVVFIGIGLIASFDEWNQSRVPMRSGQSMDIWLDVIGGMSGTVLVMLLLNFIIWKRRKRRDLRTPPFRNRKSQG